MHSGIEGGNQPYGHKIVNIAANKLPLHTITKPYKVYQKQRKKNFDATIQAPAQATPKFFRRFFRQNDHESLLFQTRYYNMVLIHSLFQNSIFSPAVVPGRRIAVGKIFFAQNTGKTFLDILAKKRDLKKCFLQSSRNFKTRMVDSPPPSPIRIGLKLVQQIS